MDRYEVFVSKDDFKFNAAHFMAHDDFRERLHGHNYRVSVRVQGPLSSDGYVVDFGDIKKATRRLCAELNERTIIPMRSQCLTIEVLDEEVHLLCRDGSRFRFPLDDCVLLEIAHSSAEELAAFIGGRLREELPVLSQRGISTLEVSVAEAPNQEARFRIDL